MTTGLEAYEVLADQIAPFDELGFYREIYENLPHITILYKVIDRETFTVAAINKSVLNAFGVIPNTNGADLRKIFPPETAQDLIRHFAHVLIVIAFLGVKCAVCFPRESFG